MNCHEDLAGGHHGSLALDAHLSNAVNAKGEEGIAGVYRL